jgi:hypothetical protein
VKYNNIARLRRALYYTQKKQQSYFFENNFYRTVTIEMTTRHAPKTHHEFIATTK